MLVMDNTGLLRAGVGSKNKQPELVAVCKERGSPPMQHPMEGLPSPKLC